LPGTRTNLLSIHSLKRSFLNNGTLTITGPFFSVPLHAILPRGHDAFYKVTEINEDGERGVAIVMFLLLGMPSEGNQVKL
jgi:hypothetical protein